MAGCAMSSQGRTATSISRRTTAMGAAARLVDSLAHRWAGGRWLATGGGGYDVYRVVPRTWAHVWLAQAHAEPPPEIPESWRDRWAADAERYGQSPIAVVGGGTGAVVQEIAGRRVGRETTT